jgi:hypothetical protein
MASSGALDAAAKRRFILLRCLPEFPRWEDIPEDLRPSDDVIELLRYEAAVGIHRRLTPLV